MGSTNRHEMPCAYLRSVPIRRVKHPIEESPVWAILGSLITGSLALVISLPMLITYLLVLPACAALRWLLRVIYYKRNFRQDGLGPEMMRGAEARWIGDEWHKSVVHAVLVLEGKDRLSLDNFRRILSTRVLPVYPRLTRLPVKLPLSAGSSMCWVQDREFSIARHVLSVPDIISNRQELQRYVARLLEEHLPQGKPPWEFHIISPIGALEDTIIVVRVHQSIADGTTLLRVLCHSLADAPAMDILERPQFGCLAFGLNVFRSCLMGPCTLFIWLWLSAGDCNPLTRRCNWTGAVTVTWSATITLPKVMRIKQVTRSTVNCVILSALAGALRVLLQGCGVRQPPNVKVLVPLDVRSSKTSKANSTALGNKSASVVVPLPVSVEGCVPRLWATRRTLSSLRSSADPVLLYMATAALMAVAPAATVCYLLDLLADKTSLQFASLPGPSTYLSVGGGRLKEMYSLVPATGHVGISVTAITYADQVYLSVASEGALGSAAKLLLANLEDQVEMMWKLLLNRRVPGEGRMSSFSYTRDIVDSPVQEIEERLSVVQKEVVRLSEDREKDSEVKLAHLKAEFAQLVGELKRRQSLGAKDEGSAIAKSRKRALSCSMPSRQSAFSLKNILTTRANSHEIETGSACENEVLRKPALHVEDEKRMGRTKGLEKQKGTPINKIDVMAIDSNLLNKDDYPTLCAKHRKNSFEIMRVQYKKKELHKQGIAKGFNIQENDLVEKGQESDNNSVETETDYSDNTIKISDDEAMDLGYDDMKSSGPINPNLRDLYCSNYLEYKLECLKRKESQLSRKISEQNNCLFPIDSENAGQEGGILI